jgi:hypothetical protein
LDLFGPGQTQTGGSIAALRNRSARYRRDWKKSYRLDVDGLLKFPPGLMAAPLTLVDATKLSRRRLVLFGTFGEIYEN